MALSPLDLAARIARRDARDAVFLDFLKRTTGWPTSAQVAAALGINHRSATKRLVAMKARGLVIRIGVAKCESTWALATDAAAQKRAVADRLKPRTRDIKSRPVDVARQRVVSASRRSLPCGLGPRSVFDLGAWA